MGFLGRFRRSNLSADDFMDRELLVPTPDTGRELGVGVLEHDEEMALVVVRDDEGRIVLPAFTSEDALNRWSPEGSYYIGLKAKVLVELLAKSEWDRMVVDGADATAFAITRSDARRLAGVTRRWIPEGSSMRIGHAAKPPPGELVEALVRACERERLVLEAYLYQFQVVDMDERPYLTVGLRLRPSADVTDTERVSRSIANQIVPARWGYEFIDIHFLDGDLLDMVQANGPPFFSRR